MAAYWPALPALPASHVGSRGGVRAVHQGHVRKTLEKLNLPRHHWLKEVDQAPEKSQIRRQKDKYLQELGKAHDDLRGLFRDDPGAQASVTEVTKEQAAQKKDASKRREDVNEALRMYRLLRPEAPPFFEEDAMRGMQAKMNKVLLRQAGEDPTAVVPQKQHKFGDPFKAYLPVVNQRAFLMALESVVASLAEDVETMCLLTGLSQDDLPAEDDPLRFKKLLDTLFSAFPLRKDPSRVEEFMDDKWPLLRNLLPEEVADLPRDTVADWLRGHLHRVRLNQRRLSSKIFLHQAKRIGDEEWYSFAEDFPYDDDPMPGELADERNLDFPLEKAEDYMRSLLGAVSRSLAATGPAAAPEGALDRDVPAQFQDLVWDLERVGLRNWLKMDTQDLERFLPKGKIANLVPGTSGSKDDIHLSKDDMEVAKLMLRCAARGRADLLDFEALDPVKLLHGLPAREVEEELAALPGNVHVSDSELTSLVDEHEVRLLRHAQLDMRSRTDGQWLKEGATVEEMYERELEFYKTAGSVEWKVDRDTDEHSWKWRQPPNTIWDGKRKVYIQQQKGVDPNLMLREMRQHMLDVTRMGSMGRVGRINYFRAIVVVGNGKGVYGFGIGFGNTPKEARADAALKALQNLEYMDMDTGRMLCFPCHGKEFKHTAAIIPRAMGRGIQANKKFLPLLYILGLDNCKVKFMHNKWFTRVRALRRALDMMISRRTLANMTGKRYALLTAPGDHWVHWPDRWFDEIRTPYDSKAAHATLARRHALHFKKRGNVTATHVEVKPGWKHENWIRWNNPLERWLQERRKVPLNLYNPDRDPTTKTAELGMGLEQPGPPSEPAPLPSGAV